MADDENSDFVASRCWPTGRRTKARSQPRRRPERNSFFDAKVVPSIAYTDPRGRLGGMTENEAKAKGVKYGRGVVPVGGERAFLAARSTRA